MFRAQYNAEDRVQNCATYDWEAISMRAEPDCATPRRFRN